MVCASCWPLIVYFMREGGGGRRQGGGEGGEGGGGGGGGGGGAVSVDVHVLHHGLSGLCRCQTWCQCQTRPVHMAKEALSARKLCHTRLSYDLYLFIFVYMNASSLHTYRHTHTHIRTYMHVS